MDQTRQLQIAAIAARQHGVFTREQAAAIGITSSAISRRVKNGSWLRPVPGVYLVPGAPATWQRAVELAVLGTGEGAVASHATSAHLWNLTKRPRVIEVTTPHTWRPPREHIIHRSTDLIAEDIALVDGIRTTTVSRCLVDISIPWGEGLAARCLDEAERRRLATAREVANVLHRVARRGRNGVGPMREVLTVRLGWSNITESQLEDEFLRILVAAGVDLPEPQVRVVRRGGKLISRVDFAYREINLVIALDGEQFHSDRVTFRNDRRQQNDLMLENNRILRFTAWDVFAAPEYVVATVVAALRGWSKPQP